MWHGNSFLKPFISFFERAVDCWGRSPSKGQAELLFCYMNDIMLLYDVLMLVGGWGLEILMMRRIWRVGENMF